MPISNKTTIEYTMIFENGNTQKIHAKSNFANTILNFSQLTNAPYYPETAYQESGSLTRIFPVLLLLRLFSVS